MKKIHLENMSEDSGFSSLAEFPVTDAAEYGSPDEINDAAAMDEEELARVKKLEREALKEERKRTREIEMKQKELEDKEYAKIIQEKRYKSLMHLLDQSQFYSSYITKKIDNSENAEPLKKRGKMAAPKSKKNMQVSPKKKKSADEKRVLREIVDMKLKKKMKRKANLSNDDIKEALELSSDEENVPAKEKKKLAKEKEFVHPERFVGVLHDYQKEGLNWLKVLNENGLNGILADEMGLGKTIQVIALLCYLIENDQPGPYLIVAPLSTLPNWVMEFERFAPELPVILFHGSKEDRANLYKNITQKVAVGNLKTQPIVLTSFEVPYFEESFLRRHNWRYIIIDEGHRIKNHDCLLAQVLRSCTSMNRLLLTGTPLQNHLRELWSLLNFLLPDLFNDLEVFESWFDVKELQHEEGARKFLKQEEEKRVLASLREILKPFMLRRVKTEVNLHIPPKKEIVIYAPLTELQHDLYKAVLSRDIEKMIMEEEPKILINPDGSRPKRRCVFKKSYNIDQLTKSSWDDLVSMPSTTKETDSELDVGTNFVFNQKNVKKNLSEWKQYTTITESNCEYLLRLKFGNRTHLYKKIINHPYLVHAPMDFSGLPKIDENIVKVSGKLLLLDKLLKNLKERGHKILLFSTMTKILDMLEDYLSLRDYLYVRLDGSMGIVERTESIKTFTNDPNTFLFLISTRAGGVGLNLTAADTVIIYDCDWNPQVDIQAMARCHRIGQTKPVIIYKFCTKGTIDEQIMKRGEAKRKLEKMIISDTELGLNLNNRETLIKLKKLLESKEHELASNEDDVISDEELNKLLDRSNMLTS